MRRAANAAQFSNVANKNTVSLSLRGTCLQISKVSLVNSQRRFVSFDAMEKVVGRYAADTFIESMNLNSRSIVSYISSLLTQLLQKSIGHPSSLIIMGSFHS